MGFHLHFLACFEQFGWHKEEEDGITITWDEDPHDSEASDGSDSDSTAAPRTQQLA